MLKPRILPVSSCRQVLLNGAGLNLPRAGHEITEDGFEVTFQVSILGAALLSELLLPALRKARGRVISINSAVRHILSNQIFAAVP